MLCPIHLRQAVHVEDSHWQPFIESMPSMPTSPVWWDEVQIAALESPVLAARITKLQDGIADNYNTYMVYGDFDIHFWTIARPHCSAFHRATHVVV